MHPAVFIADTFPPSHIEFVFLANPIAVFQPYTTAHRVPRPCSCSVDTSHATRLGESTPQPHRPIHLKDIFGPKRSADSNSAESLTLTTQSWGLDTGLAPQPLRGLNRLQAVANLALEGRNHEGCWGCADICAGERYCISISCFVLEQASCCDETLTFSRKCTVHIDRKSVV